jgi:hypothetical protein
VMGSCLMGTEFQYGMKKKFWRWTVMWMYLMLLNYILKND